MIISRRLDPVPLSKSGNGGRVSETGTVLLVFEVGEVGTEGPVAALGEAALYDRRGAAGGDRLPLFLLDVGHEFDSDPAGEAHDREFGLNWAERQGAGAGAYLRGGGRR